MCKFCPTPPFDSFLPRVRKGVAFLDENGPANWRDKIEPKSLNLADGRACVLAQVFGEYGDARRQLGICEDFAEETGFTLGDDHPDSREYDEAAWDRALTAAWVSVLSEPVAVAE